MRNYLLPILSCLGLSACATLVNGSHQSVTVSTDPPGATCKLSRQGETLGAIAMTPGSVQVSKSKNDVDVVCDKQGFQTVTVKKSPSFGGATFGNIIAGGVVGVVVDAASGANYSYPNEIHVSMAPTPTVPALAAQSPVQSPAASPVQPAIQAAAVQPSVQPTVPAVVPASAPASAMMPAKPTGRPSA